MFQSFDPLPAEPASHETVISLAGSLILLVGFPGSGKSTVGPMLAEKLSLNFADTDDIVLRNSQRASLREIIENDGEHYFREREQDACTMLAFQRGYVVATGGGTLLNDPGNPLITSPNKTVIFLRANFETTLLRLSNDRSRPLLDDASIAREVFNTRRAKYMDLSDICFDVDNTSAEVVADRLSKTLLHRYR